MTTGASTMGDVVKVPEDLKFPREWRDRIINWKEMWLRDGDQTRRLKLANTIIGVLPRILRHIDHTERNIKKIIERLARAEQRVEALQREIAKLRAETEVPCDCCREAVDSSGYCQDGCDCKPRLLLLRASAQGEKGNGNGSD